MFPIKSTSEVCMGNTGKTTNASKRFLVLMLFQSASAHRCCSVNAVFGSMKGLGGF